VTLAESPSGRDWSLGAVLAERSVDPLTYLLVVRADVGLGASVDLRRRLLRLRLAGYTTVLVDLEGSGHVSAPLVAALMQARRQLAARGGLLVVASEHAAMHQALERAGLDPIDRLDEQ
jgi:anti-anti-sigma regulatory factor